MRLAKEAELATAASRTEHAARQACRVNSFDPATRVLLASGLADSAQPSRHRRGPLLGQASNRLDPTLRSAGNSAGYCSNDS